MSTEMQTYQRLIVAVTLVLGASGAHAQSVEDPYMWLEDVDGNDAMKWVEARNQETVGILSEHPSFDTIFDTNLEILNSNERIPYVAIRGNYVYNFWQDATHEKGIWRRTTLADYISDDPVWDVVLDIDALAAEEEENWVWKGSSCLYPAY